MTMIRATVTQIMARPAPVIIVDTCNFLDLFRRDSTNRQPRVPVQEVQIASELLQLAIANPPVFHLVVPELVPGEFADHANRIEQDFEGWLRLHHEDQEWLAKATTWANMAIPAPPSVQPFGLAARLRQLANDLLAHAVVMDRDSVSLDRAVARLLVKRHPSQNKEIKDSMNVEQSLELCNQLRNAGLVNAVVFVSSNTNDFAVTSTSGQLHGDLAPDFATVALEYFPNLRAAVGSLRARGALP